MKKQIFSLMLSAAIFTTSPLFAMDKDEAGQDRVELIMHSPRLYDLPLQVPQFPQYPRSLRLVCAGQEENNGFAPSTRALIMMPCSGLGDSSDFEDSSEDEMPMPPRKLPAGYNPRSAAPDLIDMPPTPTRRVKLPRNIGDEVLKQLRTTQAI